MESYDYCILCQSFCSICKLMLVKVSRVGSFNVRKEESLKTFGDNVS